MTIPAIGDKVYTVVRGINGMMVVADNFCGTNMELLMLTAAKEAWENVEFTTLEDDGIHGGEGE